MKLRKRLLLWIAVACFSVPVTAIAITVTEPNGIGTEKIAEGVEFSAYVKGNRWDMSDPADIITSESRYLANETISNGIYQATTVEDASPDGLTDAKFFLTFPGLPSAVVSIESGQKFPIDTSIYRKLTIKIRHLDTSGLPTNSSHPVQIFFFEDENSIRDATFGSTRSFSVVSDGNWHIVEFDLINDLAPNSTYRWTDFSQVKGLRIDPTIYANTRVEVDWVRLTAPGDTNTQFNVQWSGGAGPFSITARKQNDIAVTVASGINGTSANVNFSTLPSGDYTIEVSDQQETGSSAARLRINAAPLFSFLQPDIKGDVQRRYSLVEAGNPWGPMDAADITATRQLTAINYSNPAGTLTATSTGSDSQILLNLPRAIDTLKYRMLSFTMSVSGTRDIGLGSVARVFWGNDLGALKTSEDIVVQEGLNIYELGDLQKLRVENGPAGQWQGAPTFFRFDPHEFPTPKGIRIDDVTLAPLDAADPTFTVTWLDSDPDDNADIRLYADLDKIPGNANEVLIASGIAEDTSADSFNWNANNDVVDGEYYLYAQIDDGLNQTTSYATGPILVGTGAAIRVTVTQPDGINDEVRAAEEFSRVVNGNAWDMSDGGDVPLSRSRGFASLSLAGGYLTGTSSGNDPFFYLLYPGATAGHSGADGTLTPISTSQYRYLTFKVRYTGPGPHYFQVNFLQDGTFSPGTVGFTEGLRIFPGEWNVITIDLQAQSAASSPFSWLDIPQIQGFRIDPTNIAGTGLEFDWFTLSGAPDGSSQYQVSWTATDPGGSLLDINLVDSDGVRIPMRTGVSPLAANAMIDVTRLPLGNFDVEVNAIPGPASVGSGPITIVPEIIPQPGSGNELRNISTRADVGTGNNIAIAGFIIVGNAPKCVVVTGRGPSVNIPVGEPRLPDPVLQLKAGQTVLAQNDNWQFQNNPADVSAIQNLGFTPGDILDAAIYKCLAPGAYTALLTGYLNTTGVGLIEVFDADEGLPYLRNISTRARVGTGNLVTIGGFIISGTVARQILLRGRGPSLNLPNGVQALANPKLQLMDGGTTISMNDNWQDAPNAAEIAATGKAPSDARDAAILITLPPGAYTAILSGVGGTTGMGIVEVFDLTGR